MLYTSLLIRCNMDHVFVLCPWWRLLKCSVPSRIFLLSLTVNTMLALCMFVLIESTRYFCITKLFVFSQVCDTTDTVLRSLTTNFNEFVLPH